MKRLIDVYERNFFFHIYVIKNTKSHRWFMWGSMLADVFEYIQNNLAEKDCKRAEKYLTAMADLICAGFTPVFTTDENGEITIVDESKELNIPVYPYMIRVLKYIDRLMWNTIKETKVPFISGRYHNGEFVLEDFISAEQKIVIPGHCTFIDQNALDMCHNVKEIILEEGIRSINSIMGRKNRKGLEKIVFPKSLKDMGLYEFKGCTNLKDVVFNGDCTPFSYNAFEDTIWFKQYLDSKPDNGMYIEAGTLFYYTGNDKTLVIPHNVKNIGDFALEDCDMEEIIFHDDVEYIGQGVFNGCRLLKKVVIPEKVKLIYRCFTGCSSLEEVYLPKNTEIGIIGETFYGAENVTIYGYRDNHSMQYVRDNLNLKCVFLDA